MNVDNLRLAKDMKYEALYWALGFKELEKGIFTKAYSKSFTVTIYADKQVVDFALCDNINKGKNPKIECRITKKRVLK